MNSQPLVSMVIPSYNHARYIRETIDSIIEQDYRNIELIIIDDGSSDDSVKTILSKVQECEARFVRFEFRSRENRGLVATINEAVAWSEGDYFSCLGSDDIIYPFKTSVMISFFESADPNLAALFGGVQLIDELNRLIEEVSPAVGTVPFEVLLVREHPTLFAATQMLKRKALLDVCCYQKDVTVEDWYMWLKLTHRGYGLAVLPDVLAQYRQHPGSLSRNAEKNYESRSHILSEYKSHPLYGRAIAKVLLAAAIDFSWASKKKAFTYLSQALQNDPAILGTKSFYICLLRVLTPTTLRSPLRKLLGYSSNL